MNRAETDDAPVPDVASGLDSRSKRRLFTVQMALVVLLAGYWLSMFVGTHLPSIPNVVSDKILHLCGYGGLAAVLLAWRASRGPVAFRTIGWLWLLIAGYGVFDEITQPIVGRHCDVADWIADLMGAAIGLAIMWPVASRVFASTRGVRARD